MTTRATLAAIVAWDLPGCSASLPDDAPPDADWRELLRLARAQRAEGPLATSIASGALPVTPTQADQAFAAHRSAMSLTLILERELLALHPRLVAAGVRPRVLKGAATAHLDEPDPANRAFGDLDLLVPAASMKAAIAAVEAAGGQRRFREPRPGFDTRFTKGVSFRFRRNCEVDLHRTLAPGPFGLRVDVDELAGAVERYEIGGVELTALDRPGRFLHACYHASLGDPFPRLTSLRDLVRTAPASDVECRLVLDRADRWGAGAVVATAVRHATDAFGWEAPEPLGSWVRLAPQDPRALRWLRAYAGDDRLPALQAIHGLAAIDGMADRLAYARAVALPQPAAGRTPPVERARRGARALVRLTRP